MNLNDHYMYDGTHPVFCAAVTQREASGRYPRTLLPNMLNGLAGSQPLYGQMIPWIMLQLASVLVHLLVYFLN